MKTSTLLAGALWLCTAGCGMPKNAPVVRPADMTDPNLFEQPVWIAFEAGDEIPLHLDVDGALFSVKPDAPVLIKVKQPFFVLIGDGKPKISLDRETFTSSGGSFGFHIGNTKARGPHAGVTVRMRAGGPPTD